MISANNRNNPSKNINIENCRIYSVTRAGVDFAYWRTEDSIIHGCEITKTGSYGVDANLGNYDTLHDANVLIENNHIFDYALYNKGYRPAIHMSGCGITARNNLIHDAPHMAIHYTGHNMVIENNYIYNVLNEIDDSGAIYTGRNWLGTNYITGNVIRDCSGYGNAVMGVYIDDLGSGANIKNNLFMNIKSGVALAGGIYNVLQDNIFVNLNSAYSYGARGLDGYSDDVISNLKAGIESRIGNETFLSEFPFITTLLEKEPEKTLGSRIDGNVISNCGMYTVADVVKERNEISEPVINDGLSVSVAKEGSLVISGADEATLKKAESIKHAGLTGGGNYTIPNFFTAQN